MGERCEALEMLRVAVQLSAKPARKKKGAKAARAKRGKEGQVFP